MKNSQYQELVREVIETSNSLTSQIDTHIETYGSESEASKLLLAARKQLEDLWRKANALRVYPKD